MKAQGVLACCLATALVTLLVVGPASAASLGELQASRVLFEDGVTAEGDKLLLAVVGAPGTGTTLEAQGRTLELLTHTETRCTEDGGAFDPCTAFAEEGSSTRNLTLTDFKLTITRAGDDFVLLGVKDPAHDRQFGLAARPLRVASDAAGMETLADREDVVPSEARPDRYGPSYRLLPDTPTLLVEDDEGARITGDGAAWFWAWDAVVTVSGVEADGDRYEETFRTGEYADERYPGASLQRMRWLAVTVDAEDVDLQTTDAVAVQAMALAVDAGLALLEDATGEARLPEGERTFAGGPARIADPPTFMSTGVRTQEGETYLAFDLVARDGALAPAGAPLADTSPMQSRAAAAAAGGALVAGLAAVAYYAPTLRYGATTFLLPLYSRIERSDVLNHEKREEIYQLITESPGIHAHAISAHVDVGWGTTVYHLNMLEQHGLVTSKRSGRYKRFFSASAGIGKHKEAVGVLRNETASRISQFVLDHPGTSQKDVSQALDLQPSLITWHMKKLEGAELVKKVKDGRMVRYYAGPAWADLERLDATDLGPASATFTAETGKT